MSLLKELKVAIQNGMCPPIFRADDLKLAKIEDPNSNLANYDKKNKGAKNEKVLISRIIDKKTYYSFDEQIFIKPSYGRSLECDEDNEGRRLYTNKEK